MAANKHPICVKYATQIMKKKLRNSTTTLRISTALKLSFYLTHVMQEDRLRFYLCISTILSLVSLASLALHIYCYAFILCVLPLCCVFVYFLIILV